MRPRFYSSLPSRSYHYYILRFNIINFFNAIIIANECNFIFIILKNFFNNFVIATLVEKIFEEINFTDIIIFSLIYNKCTFF